MAQQRDFHRFRHGMTLVELLMVVAIMTILMAVAIPMIRPAFQDRQLREGSRLVNVHFAGAKARAAATGRPVGVWIERQRDENNQLYATRLYLAEVSASYSGSVAGATATVEFPIAFTPPQPPPNPEWPHEFDYTSLGLLHFSDTGAYLAGLVDDLEIFFIRFDHKGPYYACLRYDQGTPNFLISISNGVPRGTEHGLSTGLSFEISRGPSKTSTSPTTLPGDTILDLTVSGVGLGQYTHSFDYEAPLPSPPATPAPPNPVIVMFTPSGQVGYVYVDNIAKIPIGPVFLLVGRRAKITSPNVATPAAIADPEQSSLADPTNLWVTINHRTGAITTDDNAATGTGTVTVLERIKAARYDARGSRQKGGR